MKNTEQLTGSGQSEIIQQKINKGESDQIVKIFEKSAEIEKFSKKCRNRNFLKKSDQIVKIFEKSDQIVKFFKKVPKQKIFKKSAEIEIF